MPAASWELGLRTNLQLGKVCHGRTSLADVRHPRAPALIEWAVANIRPHAATQQQHRDAQSEQLRPSHSHLDAPCRTYNPRVPGMFLARGPIIDNLASREVAIPDRSVGRHKLHRRKRRVGNRNSCPQNSARCHHLSIELSCERFNHAGTQPGFRLSEHAIRLTGAIVGDRKLPICS